jgi:uncharacterized protein YdeI (YjbR/CyaY-like superfamily)
LSRIVVRISYDRDAFYGWNGRKETHHRGNSTLPVCSIALLFGKRNIAVSYSQMPKKSTDKASILKTFADNDKGALGLKRLRTG